MSSEYNDFPPSYEQVFPIQNILDNIATSPLLREQFLGSVFGTAIRVNFEWDSGCPGDYSFIVRDVDGFVQAKGKVADLNTTLHSINGSEMLKICKSTSSMEQPSMVQETYQVYNNLINIGSITIAKGESAENCLKINPSNVDSQIVVRSLKLGDFALFRDSLSKIPICNIHMPHATFASEEFNGTIMFLPEMGVTTEERLICTAAAIAFKVAMKQTTVMVNNIFITTTHTTATITSNVLGDVVDDDDDKWQNLWSCIGTIILIGFFIVFLIVYS